jgi:ParB-like chromosome segregation protein Spo0J
MPCIIKHDLTDEDVLAIQIQGNALRPETTPLEYAKQIRKIMQALSAKNGADVGIIEVSNVIHKNIAWIGKQLGLLSLMPKVQKALARDEIPLESAYALTRVVTRRQCQFLDLAKTMPAKEFKSLVSAWVKRYKEAVRQGKLDDFYAEFSPVVHLRGLKEVVAEHECHDVAASALTSGNCRTPLDGWCLALQWVLHLDAASINEQRERVAERLRTHALAREAELDNEDDE